jgi:hypothetical protein
MNAAFVGFGLAVFIGLLGGEEVRRAYRPGMTRRWAFLAAEGLAATFVIVICLVRLFEIV